MKLWQTLRNAKKQNESLAGQWLLLGALSLGWLGVQQASAQDFPYPVPEEVKNGQYDITLDMAKTRELSGDFLGYNIQLLSSRYTADNPAFSGLAGELKPGNLRFPPTPLANFYNWREDKVVLPPDSAMESLQKLAQVLIERGRGFDYAAYKTLLRTSGSRPLLVVNVNTLEPKDVVDWVADIKAAGLPLPRLELGYQTYIRGYGDATTQHVQGYIAKAKAMTEAVKAQYPDVQVAVNFAPRMLLAERWNLTLAGDPFFDAVSHYFYIGGFVQQEVVNVDMPKMLAGEQFVDELVERHKQEFPGKKAWIVEWSPNQPTRQRFSHNGASAILLSSVIVRMIEHSDVIDVSSYVQLATRNGLVDVTPGGKRVIFGDFLVFKLLGESLSGARGGVGLEMKGNKHPQFGTPDAPASTTWTFEHGLATAFVTEKSVRVILINKLPVPQKVNLKLAENEATKAAIGAAQGGRLTTMGLRSLFRPTTPSGDAMGLPSSQVGLLFDVPACSVSVLELPLNGNGQ